jgi:hypothetical protein
VTPLDLDWLLDDDRPPLPPAAPGGATMRTAGLPPGWHLEWDERAAILEYDGGLPRERAEAVALAAVLGLMAAAGEPVPRGEE